jgi:phosphate transport system substrate-binding protein
MRVLAGCIYTVLMTLVLFGCESKNAKKKPQDTITSGKVYISADESFKPVIDAEVQVFEANYPGTDIVVQYKAEAEALKDFAKDSIRMIIATRKHSASEADFLVDSMNISPRSVTIARDAIAVIVHPQSPDSLFTMEEIRQILTGRFRKNLIPVFDGVRATSTVRFIVDSVLRTDSLGAHVRAARTSEGVIDYVARNQDAIGFIGVSWIGNREDTQQVSFLKKVKMAHLESRDLPGKYVLPVQANIYLGRYPMVRDLVYILKEGHNGLGHGFAGFLRGEIGQLIFKRSYLMPMQKNFRIRPIRLSE